MGVLEALENLKTTSEKTGSWFRVLVDVFFGFLFGGHDECEPHCLGMKVEQTAALGKSSQVAPHVGLR